MAYLAFDPARVRMLVRAMATARDELRRVACDDPAARDAVRVARGVATDLDMVWLPVTHRVSELDTRVDARRDLGGIDDALAWVMANGYGWSVGDDPLTAPGAAVAMTPEEARALGARMNALDPSAVVDDPSALATLTERLEAIAADPELSAEFLTNFHEWGPWGDALGRRRALLDPADSAIAALDRVCAALAHAQRAVLPAEPSTTELLDALPWLAEMSPYSAAAIVRFLGLAGNDLAAVADLLVGRVGAVQRLDPEAPVTNLDELPGPNTGDLLAPVLLADPVAAARLVQLIAAHPSSFFESFADTADGYRFVLAATDPSRMSAAMAGDVVPQIVASFLETDAVCDERCRSGEDHLDDWRAFLVDLVMPWTLQFSPGNLDWQLSRDRRNELLSFVLADDAALRRLIEHADRVAAGFIASIESDPRPPLEELGAYVAMIGGLVVNERVRNETERRKAWDLVATLAGLATAAIPGVAVAAAVSLGVVIVNSSTGPDPKRVAHEELYSLDLAATTSGAAVAHQITLQWKRRGVLPMDFPMPPEADPNDDQPSAKFLWQFQMWRAKLPGGEWSPMADRVTAAVFAVVGPPMVGEHSVTMFL